MFKYSAVGNNTPDIRKWLESIGYKCLRWDVAGVRPDTPYLTSTSNGFYTEHTLDNINTLKKLMASNGDILHDCRDNHKLFRAVSAIRDDSDYMQWYDIDDRENPCPSNQDFLIKLEDGSIRRYKEDWEDTMLIVTHWKPID